jgi:hypothetical protein
MLFSKKMQKRWQPQLHPPRIIPVLKNAHKNLFRPLSKFALEDRIRIGGASSYIRDKIDTIFLSCSYAFRAKKERSEPCVTHHDAVSDLLAFRQRHEGKTLYVAECDIQKFFDILNHDVIIESLYHVLRKLKQHDKTPIDSRALAVFKNYLNCYTYESVAIPCAEQEFKSKGLQGATLDGPKISALKEFYMRPEKVRYGVPQGGALSPIIANIVLHRADEQVFAAYGDRDRSDLFYARYCDDMILIHPQKEVCEELLNVYCDALKKLRLLVHQPMEFVRYNKVFYEVKSKKPYPWAAPAADRSSVPWVSFVGYQVAYNGNLRIREASILKETEKQKQIAAQTIRSIKKNGQWTRKSAYQILYRLRSKLCSMAVGKRTVNSTGPAEGMCWVNGFKLLKEYPYSHAQLKRLDRSRDKSISKVQYFLKRKSENLPHNAQDKDTHTEDYNEYFGHPFSYTGGFKNASAKAETGTKNN